MPVPENSVHRRRIASSGAPGASLGSCPGPELATANAWKAFYREAQSVDVTLGPLTDTEFLVLDPESKPVAGAAVEPREVLTAIGLTYSPAPKFILPILEAVTDADGRLPRPGLALRRIPLGANYDPSLGIQHQRLPDHPGPTARDSSSLRGNLRPHRRRRSTRMDAASSSPSPRPVTRSIVTPRGLRMLSRGATASFTVPAIAGGHAPVQIAKWTSATSPAIPMAGVQPNAVTNVEIRLERTVRVRGSIRDRENGHPVARAEILIGPGTPKEGETGVSIWGRFEINLTRRCDVESDIHTWLLHTVWLDPSSQRHRVPAGVEAFDLPPIEVVRGVKVQGRLVDAADQPIANVSVYADAASEESPVRHALTDGDGKFTLMNSCQGSAPRYRYSFDQGGAPEGLDPVGEVRIVRKNPLALRAPSRKRRNGDGPPPLGQFDGAMSRAMKSTDQFSACRPGPADLPCTCARAV